MPDKTILAIDTATAYAGLALYDENGVQAEETWRAARHHTTQVAGRLARMLETARLAPGDLQGLAVTLGPGSFTGLRIGLALAKGLALPHKLPIVGVPTLDVVAYPHRDSPLPVWAVVQAGRGRIAAAGYAWRESRWQQTQPARITTLADLVAALDAPALLVGEIGAADEALVENSGARASDIVVAPPSLRLRRPGVLAELGAQQLARHERSPLDQLAPIYLQTPA
ncbi:MAG: tRNA (adenosine(37)-N6)-threonylcarbamoyltransferase complex dimerization subunit type 1 TsaB [Anaerolineae bacterium]